MRYRIGIEHEYMLIDFDNRLRYFDNISYVFFEEFLLSKYGAAGDFQSNRKEQKGYWYLEGDERFNDRGKLVDLKVKGVEIRTPPLDSVKNCMTFLLEKENELSELLKLNGLKLAIAGYNPFVAKYHIDLPLNKWEYNMRKNNPAYILSEISTVSYGPDINLSFIDDNIGSMIGKAEKLAFYAPYIIPFSFSSPFCSAKKWIGPSWRTWMRRTKRPACKLYLHKNHKINHPLVYPATSDQEHGRIEFKAFDAIPMEDLFYACCYLILGICLDKKLPRGTYVPDDKLYKKVALDGFSDPSVCKICQQVLNCSINSLTMNELVDGSETINILYEMLLQKKHPSDILIKEYDTTGKMFFDGGLVDNRKWRQANE